MSADAWLIVSAAVYAIAVWVTSNRASRGSYDYLEYYRRRLRGEYTIVNGAAKADIDKLLEDNPNWAKRAGVARVWVRIKLGFAPFPDETVLSGWREAHAAEVQLASAVDDDEATVTARLVATGSSLAALDQPGARSGALRIDQVLRKQEPSPDDRLVASIEATLDALGKSGGKASRKLARKIRRALAKHAGKPSADDDEARTRLAELQAELREALTRYFDLRDAYFERLANSGQIAAWLSYLGLVAVIVLGVVFDHEKLLLLGAVGGLVFRLTRELRRSPTASDYGDAWSRLMLGPIGGALAAWIGVLIVHVLSTNSAVKIFDSSLGIDWSNNPNTQTMVLALLLGVSERLFDKVVGTAQTRFGPQTESSAATAGAIGASIATSPQSGSTPP